MENVTFWNNDDCGNDTDLYFLSIYSLPTSSACIVLLSILYGITGLVSVCGNSLIVAAYVTGSNVRKFPFNTFILNLAVADFFVGSVADPLYIYALVVQNSINSYVYLIWSCMASFFIFTSVLITLLMSFDRYQLVSDAIKYNRRTTSRRICYSIIPVWVLSLLSTFTMSTIFVYISKLFTTEPCSRWTYTLYGVYLTGLFIYGYLFPLGILIFLNLAIYIKLVIRSKQFMNQKRCGGGKTKYNIPVISGMEEERQNRDVTSPPSFAKDEEPVAAATTKISMVALDEDALSNETSKKKMETTEKNNSEGQGSVNVKTLQKAGRQLFTLVSVFVVCWFPLHLVLLLSISNSWSWAGNELWYYVPHVFLASNSAINPFLYLKVCRRYRVQVLHIISQLRKKLRF